MFDKKLWSLITAWSKDKTIYNAKEIDYYRISLQDRRNKANNLNDTFDDKELWRLITNWAEAKPRRDISNQTLAACKAIDAYRKTLEDKRTPRGKPL